MSLLQQLSGQVANLAQRLNDIENAAKTNDELPLQLPVNLLSKIRASIQGTSGVITIKNIVDAAVAESQLYLNQFLTIGGFALVANELKINAGWSWLIHGRNFANNSEQVFEIPFAANGKSRIDIIVAISANNLSLLRGNETEGIPAAPAMPENALQATFMIVTENSITEPIEPVTIINNYLGLFSTEAALVSFLTRPARKNDWGWIVNSEIFKVAIHSGTSWVFHNLGGGSSDGIKNITVLTSLYELGIVSFQDINPEIVTGFIVESGLTINTGENYFFEFFEPITNIDLVSNDWGAEGVIDRESFLDWLATTNPDASIIHFSLIEGRIRALVENITSLYLLYNFGHIYILPETLSTLTIDSNENLYTLPYKFPPFLTTLNISGSPLITSIYSLPAWLETCNLGFLSISSLPPLPPTLKYFTTINTDFDTAALDVLVDQFLIGSLPKNYWGSNSQSTGDQPSAPKKSLLNNPLNVTSSDY